MRFSVTPLPGWTACVVAYAYSMPSGETSIWSVPAGTVPTVRTAPLRVSSCTCCPEIQYAPPGPTAVAHPAIRFTGVDATARPAASRMTIAWCGVAVSTAMCCGAGGGGQRRADDRPADLEPDHGPSPLGDVRVCGRGTRLDREGFVSSVRAGGG